MCFEKHMESTWNLYINKTTWTWQLYIKTLAAGKLPANDTGYSLMKMFANRYHTSSLNWERCVW